MVGEVRDLALSLDLGHMGQYDRRLALGVDVGQELVGGEHRVRELVDAVDDRHRKPEGLVRVPDGLPLLVRARRIDRADHPFHVGIDDVADLEVRGIDHQHAPERRARRGITDERQQRIGIVDGGGGVQERHARIFS